MNSQRLEQISPQGVALSRCCGCRGGDSAADEVGAVVTLDIDSLGAQLIKQREPQKVAGGDNREV